jgi:hypothetical protein
MVFNPQNCNDQNKGWEDLYVLSDIELTVTFFPFVILWVIFLLIKKSRPKKVLNFILLGISFLYCFFSIGDFGFAMDYSPNFGVLISLLLFPTVLTITISEYLIKSAANRA